MNKHVSKQVSLLDSISNRKVQVGKDQEKAQSEKIPTPKTESYIRLQLQGTSFPHPIYRLILQLWTNCNVYFAINRITVK